MSQGAVDAPAWFISVFRHFTAGLEIIRIYIDNAIGSGGCPFNHIATLATLFVRLRLHQLELSPDKSTIRASRVDFIGHLTSANGVHFFGQCRHTITYVYV